MNSSSEEDGERNQGKMKQNELDIKELTREDSPSFNKDDEILTSRSGKSNIGGFKMQFEDAAPQSP